MNILRFTVKLDYPMSAVEARSQFESEVRKMLPGNRPFVSWYLESVYPLENKVLDHHRSGFLFTFVEVGYTVERAQTSEILSWVNG